MSNIQHSTTNDQTGNPAEPAVTQRKDFDLEVRLIDFAIAMIDITESLQSSRAANHIAGQLVRAGTAPASNYGEAQSAESRRDFVHKMRIAFKELRETRIWLQMVSRKALCNDRRTTSATNIASIQIKSR